jgi:hypothetical protein
MLSLLLLLGCGQAPPSTTTPSTEAVAAPEAPKPLGGPTQRGAYVVALELVPNPPPLSELFEVKVTLTDPQTGAPISDAIVAVDAQMPQHGHGMSTDPIDDPGSCDAAGVCTHPGGVYRTTGMKFHMPGKWSVSIDVSGPRGADRLVLPYELL